MRLPPRNAAELEFGASDVKVGVTSKYMTF